MMSNSVFAIVVLVAVGIAVGRAVRHYRGLGGSGRSRFGDGGAPGVPGAGDATSGSWSQNHGGHHHGGHDAGGSVFGGGHDHSGGGFSGGGGHH